jgi:TolA-binding protein
MLCTACASLSPEPAPDPANSLLRQADAMLVAENYGGALALYAGFVQAHPDDTQAARARATRTALDRLLLSQSELDHLRRSDELPLLKRDISNRRSEVDRLKRDLSDRQSEVDRLKAEMAKLRADLERLRNIDLQELRAEPKK